MLQNAYLLAKIGADTAENEQHFAEILPTDALWRLRTQRAARPRRGLREAQGEAARPAAEVQVERPKGPGLFDTGQLAG